MWNKIQIKSLLICLIIGFSSIAISTAQNGPVAETKLEGDLITPKPIKVNTKNQTITDPTSTSTTTTTTTTTTSTTTTTTKPAPETTTTTSTTTVAPSPDPITTTPKPSPTPDPSIGKWNSSCAMIQMAVQLNFTYETTDNKSVRVLYNIPADAPVKYHTCTDQTQQLSVEWGPITGVNSMMIQFDANSTTHSFTLYEIFFKIVTFGDDFPNAKDNTISLLYIGNIFETPVKMSYHCTREQVLNLTETVSETKPIGKVTIRDLQMEAFRTGNSTNFSTAKDCDAIDTPDIVPIAVGIAMAALILVVLISYLLARRRSTARGYMSF